MRMGIQYSIILTVWSAAFLGAPIGVPAMAARQPSEGQQGVLKKFLQSYVGPAAAESNRDTRYFSAFVALSGHGAADAIIYLIGDEWCGSGGCAALVLAPRGSSYRVVTYMTITRPPIRVLATKSHGWHDISVAVAGGGPPPRYEAKLSFNGKSYPRNPSVPPAQPLTKKTPGKIVIPSTVFEKSSPLYP
jgi:hypothetical protein